MKQVVESGHSRFPVHGEDKDEILGILLAKDLLRGVVADNGPGTVRELLRPAVLIPESKRLDVLLREFRQSRNHMAIVIDEYGGVAGLLTIEDVLEQIVGEIDDEHDDAEDPGALIAAQADGQYVVDALTPIADFNERFGADFDDDEYDTIGGLVTAAIGHLPDAGEELTLGRFGFRVARADARRLHACCRILSVLDRPDETSNRFPHLPRDAEEAGLNRLRIPAWRAAVRCCAAGCGLGARVAARSRRCASASRRCSRATVFFERFGHDAIVVDDPARRRADLVQLRLLRSGRAGFPRQLRPRRDALPAGGAAVRRGHGLLPRSRPRRVDPVARPQRRRSRKPRRRAGREREAGERALRLRLLHRQLRHPRARCDRQGAGRRAEAPDRRALARQHLSQRIGAAGIAGVVDVAGFRCRPRACGRPAAVASGRRPSCRCAWPTALREVHGNDGRPLVQCRTTHPAASHRPGARGVRRAAGGRGCCAGWRSRPSCSWATPRAPRVVAAARASVLGAVRRRSAR